MGLQKAIPGIARPLWQSHRRAYSLAPSGNLRQRCHEASDQVYALNLSVPMCQSECLVRTEPGAWSTPTRSFRILVAVKTYDLVVIGSGMPPPRSRERADPKGGPDGCRRGSS